MKLNDKIAEHYYNAAEAKRVLGIDDNTFQYWGRDGRITRTYLPGRKQPLYLKKEINEIAHQVEAALLIQKKEPVIYRKATINDLETQYQLGLLVFGRSANPVEVTKAFMEVNPDIEYHLYDQDTLVAYLNIMPLKHQAIEDFMSGKIRGWQISTDDLEQFEPGKPLELLIMNFVSTPTVPPAQRNYYSSRLLVHVLQTLAELGNQGVEITKLYTVSGTATGQRIIENAKFKKIGEAGGGRMRTS